MIPLIRLNRKSSKFKLYHYYYKAEPLGTLMERLEKKLNRNYTRKLTTVFNKF